MKVLLVALNAKYVHSCLAVHDIASYANLHAEFDGEIKVAEYTINHNLDAMLSMIYKEQADVVAFSTYIWNRHEILSIAKNLSRIAPETKIWLGGPEVSYDSKELLVKHTYIDGIIVGEGEETFAELIGALSKSMSPANIRGITFRSGDKIVANPVRNLLNMDDIPFIYDDLSAFDNKILYYESSRGCPFNCSYCLSSIDKRVRFRSMTLVKEELRKFLDAKVPQVKFIDRTFNCRKDRALEIWGFINEHDNGVTNFHFEISADLIGREELELFRTMRPGLIQLEIGLQTTNEETIREIRRTMDINRLRHNMLEIRAMGNIHQHLDLIAGLPYEDLGSFIKSFNDAYDMRPHQLQLGFLKVLKGSHMETMRDKYGLIYSDEQPYEVMATKWITYDDVLLLKKVEEMVEVYHNSGQFENVLPFVLELFDSPFEFFRSLGNFYEENELFGIGMKRETRYVILREFVHNHLGNDADGVLLRTFDDLLTFDYYIRDNVKTRPSWSTEEPIPRAAYQSFFKNGGTDSYRLPEGASGASKYVHIEPVGAEALQRLALTFDCSADTGYCLFDYSDRDPLSNNARVVFLGEI